MLILTLLTVFQGPVVGPAFPAGSSGHFQRACLAVEDDLEAGRFSAAEAKLARYPTPALTIEWDDRKVPVSRKNEFAKARDKAIAAWKDAIDGLNVQIVKGGRAKITFADALPENADSIGPAGAVFIQSADQGDPWIEAVISLHRGTQRTTSESADVYNEVGYMIGAYFGLERGPHTGSFMGRHDEVSRWTLAPLEIDIHVIRDNLKILNTLRTAAKKHLRMIPGRPHLVINPSELKLDPVVQGQPVRVSMSVSNQGTGILNYRIVPDCGCFNLQYESSIKPGDSKLVVVQINTLDFPGDLHKVLTVQSNDLESSRRAIPVSLLVEPKYRFLRTSSGPVYLVPKQGGQFDLLLDIEQRRPFSVKAAQIDGLHATLTYEPWSGLAPDYEMGTPAKARTGYKFHIALTEEISTGRLPLTLVVDTDDPIFSHIRQSFYIQRGIVALPSSVYFGEVGKEPARATAYLSRPDQPFNILRAVSDTKFFKAAIEPMPGKGEYKLIISYLGNGDFGDLEGTIKVMTDDPEQPEIAVPVRAVVH